MRDQSGDKNPCWRGGFRKIPIYKSWVAMKQRCKNPNDSRYYRYGGRGISFCERWEDYNNFFNDMSEGHSNGLTLERIDPDKDYSPENCKWIPRNEQQKNRSSNTFIVFNGERRCVTEWERILGFKKSTVMSRIKRWGWTPEKALTTPPIHKSRVTA